MVTNLWQNYLPPCTYRSGILKLNRYRYLNMRINSINISCKNFVNFGPVTPQKTGLICELFVRHGKKLAYLVEYLTIYWTDFYDLFNT